MTDRELLQAAAKAVDLRVFDWLPGRAGFAYGDSITNRWNPLEDDGDALRLAVKLSINVVPNYFAEWHRADGGVGRAYTTETGDAAIYAATRRSIVRAAAAMAA